MLFEDSYKTVSQLAEGSYNVSGSKFIAYIIPVTGDSDIRPAIVKIKGLQPGASHYCWACKLAGEQTNSRFNDDGEPAGSAGRPILNVIFSQQLSNVLIVVVRYFGGTLLGIPGLIAAYKTAVLAALKNADIIKEVFRDYYKIEFAYADLNSVMMFAKEFDVTIADKAIDNTCSLLIGIPKQKVELSLSKLCTINTTQLYLYSK